MIGSRRIDAVFVGDDLPELSETGLNHAFAFLSREKPCRVYYLGADLVTALSGLKMNDFAHRLDTETRRASAAAAAGARFVWSVGVTTDCC